MVGQSGGRGGGGGRWKEFHERISGCANFMRLTKEREDSLEEEKEYLWHRAP